MDTEGFVQVTGGKVWYRIAGGPVGSAGRGVPVLALHGGPGGFSDSLDALDGLAGSRPVVYYDQLGGGNSDRPDDAWLWTVDRFTLELAEVREALGLDRVHILGQSWGTILAVEHALTGPRGLVSLVLADPGLSVPKFVEDAARLRAALPERVRNVLDWHEETGRTNCLEYQWAVAEFYKRHLCRLEPWPEGIEKAAMGMMGTAVYRTMWGPNEFVVTGTLIDYDVTGRLAELSVPVLYLCGRYDECTPEATEWYASLTPGARMVVFEQSAHQPHYEETERYLEVLEGFLAGAEASVKL